MAEVIAIAKHKLLGLLNNRTPEPAYAWWVAALLTDPLIPLTPAILDGFKKAFPSIPRERYIDAANS